MYLDENIKILKSIFQGINWDKLYDFANACDENKIKIVETRSGLKTMEIKRNGINMFVHSKYDPETEAEKLASLNEISDDKHILFYGIGLGYLIKAYTKKYPEVKYSIYEPDPLILYHFLCHISLRVFSINNLQSIYIDNFFEESELVKHAFFQKFDESLVLVNLPSIEKLYNIEYKEFSNRLLNSIKDRRINNRTKYSLERMWMLNSLENYKYLIKTPNILHMDNKCFKDKPAILVSAGPSLNEELENLRFIKQRGLAYIFSVGSALYSLIENGIKPDAIFALDADETNYDLYKIVFEKSDNDIPLCFSPALYHKVVSSYNSKMFHHLITRDTIASYYLRLENGDEFKTVNSAPSVAITTLQLLHKLKFDPIILVGQNFAFKNDRYYSDGIDLYEERKSLMSDNDRKEMFLTESVDGGMVYTKDVLDTMRRQTSLAISYAKMTNVINATRGGAKIEGTAYETLESIINNKLNKSVVQKDWYDSDKIKYDNKYLLDQSQKMKEEFDNATEILKNLEKRNEELKKVNYSRKEKSVNRLLNGFSKEFSKLMRNKFYEVFLLAINTVQTEILLKKIQNLSKEMDIIKRAKNVSEEFEIFINNSKNEIRIFEPYLKKMYEYILDYTGNEGSNDYNH